MALLCRLLEPTGDFGEVTGNARPVRVHLRQLQPRPEVPLLCRPPKPVCRRRLVLRKAVTLQKHPAKPVLSPDMTLSPDATSRGVVNANCMVLVLHARH